MNSNRELAFGVYEATPAFRSIEQHSCVCYADDMGLVAVTGPADDKESQEYAELFAQAPAMKKALEEVTAIIETQMYTDGFEKQLNEFVLRNRATLAAPQGKE